ncbi:MAG: GntR family transcriptional regulator [Candidatus Bipolaricaulia bacterium]
MKLNKQSLGDQIYGEIKKRIIDLEIKPGDKIQPSHLEEEFGVSRAPIREALHRLKGDGLVEAKPRVGYFVTEITQDKIRDLYDLRVLFETYGLETALTRISKERIENLKQESTRLLEDNLSKSKIRERFDKIDKELHLELILENANNQFLQHYSSKTINLIRVTRHLNERIEEALREHIKILDALEKRDPNQGKDYLTLHLRNVEAEILENLKESNTN